MKITYIGHACFKIQDEGFLIVIDPYQKGYVPGLKEIKEAADLVLCSHEHADHSGRTSVTNKQRDIDCPFMVRAIGSWHDDKEGSLRGNNTIYILQTDTMKIVHMGDIGCELTQDQIDALKDADVLMIPVGGYYTIDAVQAKQMMDQLNPKVCVPMHYRGETYGFDEIATVDPFIALCKDDNVVECGSRLLITKDMPKQVAVMKPLNA